MDGNYIKVNHKPSSNGAACWYDVGNRVLKVMFPTGTYLYSNVLPAFADRLADEQDSVGTLLREVTTHPETYPVTKL